MRCESGDFPGRKSETEGRTWKVGLKPYIASNFASSDYVAFALYGSNAYRAYGQGSAKLTPNGQLVFNASNAATGTVGKWTAVSGSGSGSVPEPTSGMLMLLGFAGLALKRKRA